MSRVIVKNLPKNITENKLRKLFGQKGVITDIQLKKCTKRGVFQQIAFIGYQNKSEAEAALKYFNNSCIQKSQIKVKRCTPSPLDAGDKLSEEGEKRRKELKKTKKNVTDEIVGEHKNGPISTEFMEAHSRDRTLCDNEETMANSNTIETTTESEVEDVPGKYVKLIKTKTIKGQSDNDDDVDNRDGDNDDDEDSDDNSDRDSGNVSENRKNDEEGHDEETTEELTEKEISDLESKSLTKSISTNKKMVDLYTIKIHNIPYQTKYRDILILFKPLKPHSIKIPKNVQGSCYVHFRTEEEFKKAMLKDKSFIKKNQVFFLDFTKESRIAKSLLRNERLKQENMKNKEEILESGKIFFRNLAHTTTEDDLKELFEKYGPIAEINLPVDPITRQIKCFGTVKFSTPEHAVRAFSELDGLMFQGRLLHLKPMKRNDKKEKRKQISESGRIVVKNLAYTTTEDDLKELFEKYGPIAEINLPVDPITRQIKGFGTVTFVTPEHAVIAFSELDGSMFQGRFLLLYPGESGKKTEGSKKNGNPEEKENEPLEPETNIFESKKEKNMEKSSKEDESEEITTSGVVEEIITENSKENENPEENENEPETTIFVSKQEKNMQKSNEEDESEEISTSGVVEEIKTEGNQIELKRSDQILDKQVRSAPRNVFQAKQTGTKILVQNIPLQAKPNEILDILKVFGELRSVNIPKKMTPGENQHRGFGFVHYFSKSDAEKAFATLCQGTYLYGQRLHVQWVYKRDDKFFKLRKRTAEHFNGGRGTYYNAKRSRFRY